MSTINELKGRAEEIRNATAKGSNTAEKVGGLLYDMNSYMEDMPVSCDSSFSDTSEHPVQNNVINSRFVRNENQLNTLTGRVSSVEEFSAETDAKLTSNYYNKTQVNNIVSSTPETDIVVVDELPSEGESNTLYRVPGSGNTTYAEWAWDGTDWVKLAEKDYGIDDVPTSGSDNVVKSGGIHTANMVYSGNFSFTPLNGTVELKRWTGDFPAGTHYVIRLIGGAFAGTGAALKLVNENSSTIASITSDYFSDFVLDGVLPSSAEYLKLVVTGSYATSVSGYAYASIDNNVSANPYVTDYIESYADGLRELYLKDISSEANYYLFIVKTASYYYIQIFNSSTYDNANLVAEASYKADGTSDAVANVVSKNNSGISGKVIFYIDSVKGMGTNTFKTSPHLINNKNACNLSMSPAIYSSYLVTNTTRTIVVNKAGGKDYTSLYEGILDAVQTLDSVVYVEGGDYDLVEEFEDYFGNSFFDTYTGSPRGILLKNRVRIIFSSTAKVTFNYEGTNADVLSKFCPFYSGVYGFTLENLNLSASNCFYAVYDNRGDKDDLYINKYIGCNIYLDNSTNNYYYHPSPSSSEKHGFHECISGAFGKNGYIEIKDCTFESVWPAGGNPPSTGLDIVAYRNGTLNDAKSSLVLSNNYFKGKTGFKLAWYGPSTEISQALISNNSFGMDVVHKAENAAVYNVENTAYLAWNNVIRE